jgi:hypothetical protein
LFIEYIERNGYFDTHIYPQSEFLRGIIIDNFYTIESMVSGINHIRSKCNISSKISNLPVMRRRKNHGKMASYYFTKSDIPAGMQTKIRNLYIKDFELYKQVLENTIIK